MTEQTGNNKPNEAEGLAFPLSGNEKLIEEAAQAIAREWRNVRSHEDMARAALAVFEKALTPTDDSSVETWVCGKCGGDAYEHSLTTSTCIWEPIETRPEPQGEPSAEVPEPSAEPKHDESCAEWCNHCQACGEGIRYGSRCREHYQNQPQGKKSGRVIVMCARCGLFPVVAGDEINIDIVVCDRCAFAEGRESVHGEPSGAELLAALYAYEAKAREQDNFPAMAAPRDLTWFSGASVERMRAALRAAGGVR